MHFTTANCFRHCGYGHEHNTEADSDSTEEEDYAFQENWIRLGAKKDVDCSLYTSAEGEPAMCSISSIDELCADHEGVGSSWGGGGGGVRVCSNTACSSDDDDDDDGVTEGSISTSSILLNILKRVPSIFYSAYQCVFLTYTNILQFKHQN
jgi:hypothetical protein